MSILYNDLTDQAAKLMQKADDGDAKAQHDFGTYLLREADYSYRKNLNQEDVERGMDYLRLSAAQGYFQGLAADDLGMIYFEGIIVSQDYTKAKMWFNTACLKGIPTSEYMLGECAYYGYDEDINYEKAAMHYIKAAPRFINSLVRLADMYMRGEYLPYDPVFAKELYEHVQLSEEWLYKVNGFYSDAHGIALQRLDDWKRAKISADYTVSDSFGESDELLAIRGTLLKIIKDEEENWKNWVENLKKKAKK